MAFSGTVKLADLNDFLAPAQDCSVAPRKPAAASATPGTAIKLELEETKAPLPPPIRTEPNLIKKREGVAAVSLADCLACSGCVTSAETVLL